MVLNYKKIQFIIPTIKHIIMETFELDPNILHSIFKHQIFTEQVVKQLTEWHHSLDPSCNLMKSILAQYFQNNQQSLIIAAKKIWCVILSLQQKKFPKSFIRAVLAIIKSNLKNVQQLINYEVVAQKWATINVDILQYYFQAFNISIDAPKYSTCQSKIKIPLKEAEERIHTLIDSKEYENAMNLIKIIGYPEHQTKSLLQKMANSKDASKAANMIKSHKIDVNLVPQVGERLNKNMVRHFLKSNGWEGAEQIFFDHQQALACLVQDLIFKKKNKQAISIWWRHPSIMKHITKQQALLFLQQQISKPKQVIELEVLKNPLFNDYFGPSQPEKHLTLKQFGIQRQSVIWVQQQSPEIKLLCKQIQNAQLLAIDTESLVGKSKLQRKRLEPASIIQIAFREKIFILDGHRGKDERLRAAIIEFAKSGRPLLGHAISNDLETMLFSMGFNESQVKLIRFDRIVDTCQLFKAIFVNEKYSNLSHICKIVLKKQVCKQQTLTNWGRRPLRQNQLHYAAMDAYCVIKIFDALREEVGQNMLNYFLDQDI